MGVWLQGEGKERRGDRSVPRLDPALAAATHPCRGGWPCLHHDNNEQAEGGDACDAEDNKDDDDNKDVGGDGDHGGDDGDGDMVLIICFNMNVLTTKVACFGLLDDPRGADTSPPKWHQELNTHRVIEFRV